jgi:predicted acetyltransferase
MSAARIGPVPADRLEDFFRAMGVPFSFEPTEDDLAEARDFWDPEWLTAAWEDDRIVATFGSFPLRMRLPGGTTIPTGGTTVVTVMPTHRRQGLLRRLMRDHLDREREAGSAMAALWASEATIYGRFGYGIASDDWRLTLPRRHAVLADPPDITGRMRLVSAEEAARLLPPVFEAATADRPGTFERTDHWWRNRILRDPAHHRSGYTPRRIVVHHRDGEDVGYAFWRTKGGDEGLELIVSELLGIDPAAEQALWQFLFGVDLVTEIKAPRRPSGDLLRWWLADPRRLERQESDALWVRPLDVAACLEQRRWDVDGAVVLEVHDPWYEDVTGRWRLEASGGAATVTRTDEEAAVSMGVDTLGTLLMGGFGAEVLARAGRLGGTPDAVRAVDRLFRWPVPPWVQEVF